MQNNDYMDKIKYNGKKLKHIYFTLITIRLWACILAVGLWIDADFIFFNFSLGLSFTLFCCTGFLALILAVNLTKIVAYKYIYLI